MPEIVPCHRAAKFPEHLTPRMGALRFYAPHLKEHGCAGLSHTAYGLIMQELERADSGLRSQASVQGSLAIYAIYSFGTPEQHARWLPGLVSGDACRLFRANGTWARLGPWRDGNPRQPRRRPLCFERQQVLDRQCLDRGCESGMGER